jgi:hypothetical protein
MPFITKLDFSNNRQVKQYIETNTSLSGGTTFGVPFSYLPTGASPTTSAVTVSYSGVVSTFSGNSGTTVYTWYDSNMNLALPNLSALTPSISATTQNTGIVFTSATSTTTVDGNFVNLTYTGVSFDITPISFYDLGSGNYSGTVHTNLLEVLSAGTLDYTGRTIWVDVSGITRTQELIVSKNPGVGFVLTCVDSEGRVEFGPVSGASTGYWTAGTGTGAIYVISGGNAANGDYSLAEGLATTANGDYSHVEGYTSIAGGNYSHAEGYSTSAGGNANHAEGYLTIATGGEGAHSEGRQTTASGNISHAEGYATTASGNYAHSEGNTTTAYGSSSHAEGNITYARGDQSHAEGYYTTAFAISSHAEGQYTIASGDISHSEGSGTTASGNYSHAEGYATTTEGYSSHAEGNRTYAFGTESHAEGNKSTAYGDVSHAEGYYTQAIGNYSHAGGSQSIASGITSFVHGSGSNAGGTSTIVLGDGIIGTQSNYTYVESLNIKTVGSTAFANDIRIAANGNLTTNTSDERLKENVLPLTNSLNKIKQLNGVTYQWKDREAGGDDVRIGFIAQQVEQVEPLLVFTNKVDGYKGIHVDSIIPMLVEAVKELSYGTTTSGNSYVETQSIIAEDNNIDLNYGGTPQTAIEGGIRVLHALDKDVSAELITDTDGNWTTNNDFKPNALTIPVYTPESSMDTFGNEGNITRDDDFLYVKTSKGWKRANLESF